MKPITAICVVMLVAAPAPGFAENMPYPDFGSIAKQPPASKEPPPATQPPIAPPPASQPTDVERESWRKRIVATPRPKDGCFTATYPETEWREVPCKTPPNKLYPPKRGGMIRTETVGGNGSDYSAVVTGDMTTGAEGSFDPGTVVSGECAVQCPPQKGAPVCPTNPTCTGAHANEYSLQLNTQPFTTQTCNGSPAPGGCQGWEQFIYTSSGSGGGFIQYWLENYGPAGTACPTPRGASCVSDPTQAKVFTDGWCPFSSTPGGEVYCVVNSVRSAPAPSQPATSLDQLKLAATAFGLPWSTNDSVTVTVGGTPYTASGNSYFPDLGGGWQETEFNVFGDANGEQAFFNSGTTIHVRTTITAVVLPWAPTTSPPSVDQRSFTGESNSLNLVPPYCPFGGAPAIVFTESNVAGATSTCACSGSKWNSVTATCWGPPIQPTDCTVLQECNGWVDGGCLDRLVLNQPGTDSRLLYRSDDGQNGPYKPIEPIDLVDTNPPYGQTTWYKICDSNPGGFPLACSPPRSITPTRLTCPPPGGAGGGAGCYLGGIPVPCFRCQQGPAHPAGCKLQ